MHNVHAVQHSYKYSVSYSERQFSPAGISLLQDGEELEESELALVMVDTQVLSLALDRGQSAHGHATYIVVC